ncbi:MAG: helix-turn-helix transcriptional regulator [Treponema sp.]|nr:helix-turn-helix transcriptional regulator [Treponema sp.]
MNRITNLLRPVPDLRATGEKIKLLMDAGGISVRDLQSFFGFEHPQAVYAWLNGRNLPTVDNLLVLSELFDVTIDEIVRKKFVG